MLLTFRDRLARAFRGSNREPAKVARESIRALAPFQRAKLLHWMVSKAELFASPRHIADAALMLMQRLTPSKRGEALDTLLREPAIVDTPHGQIRFLTHSRRGCLRGEKILTKEPDSLKWIDTMTPGSVFWDIGANVGTLTLYAATRGDLDVWAFEPAAVNFYNLAANCELNGLSDKVHCLLLGFGEANGIAKLNASQFRGADSFSFTEKPGKTYIAVQTAPLWTIDDFIAHYRLSCPNYIKIDVPGLSQAILTGAARTLGCPELRQLQIEAKEEGRGGRWIAEYLAKFGFAVFARNMKRGGTVPGDLVFAR